MIVQCDAWLVGRPTSRVLTAPRPRHHLSATSKDDEIDILKGEWNSTKFGATKSWRKRPLLLKGAFATESLPTWEEVLELACCAGDDEEAIMAESLTCRLIQHKPDTLDTYTVDFGPFANPEEVQGFLVNQRTETASTLVVNDVDRWIPDLSDWMDRHFAFLPRWRRDDAQVSLAATGGGIGPHVDNYDVFLIQTAGSREWEVASTTISTQDEMENLVEASQVRILNLTALELNTTVVELEPGDCLYLPPRYAHWGTSLSDDCVTLSVGCRTPSASDILSKLTESVAMSTLEAAVRRYTDSNLLTTTTSGSLSTGVRGKMQNLVTNLVQDLVNDDKFFDDMIGRLITEPNRPVYDYPTPLYEMDEAWKESLGVWGDAEATFDAVLDGYGVLRRAEGLSFAWSFLPDSLKGNLYVKGEAYPIEATKKSRKAVEALLDRVSNGPPIDGAWLNETIIIEDEMDESMEEFLLEMLEEGLIYGDETFEEADA